MKKRISALVIALVFAIMLTATADAAFRGTILISNEKGIVTPNSVKASLERFEIKPKDTFHILIATNSTGIADKAFEGQIYMYGDFKLPEGIEWIGNYAFYEHKLSGRITIPEGTISIGNFAFTRSRFAKALSLPSSLERIGESAFEESIYIRGDLLIPTMILTIPKRAFFGCDGLNGILAFPDSLTSIGEGSFAFCDHLKGQLTLPQKLQTIGQRAFAYCEGFYDRLTIPPEVKRIDWQAFYSCEGLSSIWFEGTTPPTIGDGAFDSIKKNLDVYVPMGTRKAYEEAFKKNGATPDGGMNLFEYLPSKIKIQSQAEPVVMVNYGEVSESLFVKASLPGSSGLRYRWIKKVEHSVNDYTVIPGETTAMYQIPDNLPVGVHYFQCIIGANGVAERISREFKVVVRRLQMELTYPAKGSNVGFWDCKIEGWALYTEDGLTDSIGKVEILMDGKRKGWAQRSGYPALEEKYPQYGQYNYAKFEYTIPNSDITSGKHKLTVNFYDRHGNLLSSEVRNIEKSDPRNPPRQY